MAVRPVQPIRIQRPRVGPVLADFRNRIDGSQLNGLQIRNMFIGTKLESINQRACDGARAVSAIGLGYEIGSDLRHHFPKIPTNPLYHICFTVSEAMPKLFFVFSRELFKHVINDYGQEAVSLSLQEMFTRSKYNNKGKKIAAVIWATFSPDQRARILMSILSSDFTSGLGIFKSLYLPKDEGNVIQLFGLSTPKGFDEAADLLNSMELWRKDNAQIGAKVLVNLTVEMSSQIIFHGSSGLGSELLKIMADLDLRQTAKIIDALAKLDIDRTKKTIEEYYLLDRSKCQSLLAQCHAKREILERIWPWIGEEIGNKLAPTLSLKERITATAENIYLQLTDPPHSKGALSDGRLKFRNLIHLLFDKKLNAYEEEILINVIAKMISLHPKDGLIDFTETMMGFINLKQHPHPDHDKTTEAIDFAEKLATKIDAALKKIKP